MKKLQLLAYFLLISFTTLSCKEDKPEEVPPTPESKKLCKVTSVTYGSNSNETYEYTNNRITKILDNSGSYTNFEYNADGKVVKINYYNSSGTLTFYDTYEYTSNVLITFKSYKRQPNAEYIATTSNGLLEFNAQGQLTKIQYSVGEYWRYEYDANGNMIKSYAKLTPSGQTTETLKYEYTSFDNKINFIIEDATLKIYNSTNNRGGYLSKNNYTQYKEYFTNTTNTINIVYEYNERGYPTKKTQGTNVEIYQYNCQ